MRILFRVALVVVFVMSTNDRSIALAADDAKYIGHEVEHHFIDAKNVPGQRYKITVMQPYSKADGSERFPVLYVPDANFMLGLVTGTTLLMQNFDLDRFIVVGVGYAQAEFDLQTTVLRQRDLTPTYPESLKGGKAKSVIRGLVHVDEATKAGGANNFLKFFHEELFPFIDQRYPTVPTDRAYFGASYGGLFGLYAMFNRPETFNRYIIGSPSVGFDQDAILRIAQTFIDSGKPLNARVFIGGGGLEPNFQVPAGPIPNAGTFGMITNFYRLEGMLRSAKIKGLDLKFQMFPGETHYTVPAFLYVRGVQEVFGKPRCPLLTYAGQSKPADCDGMVTK